MSYQAPMSWQGCLMHSVLALLLVALMLTKLGPDAGIVPFEQLAVATGSVQDVRVHRYGVRFRLSGHSQLFNYSSRSAVKRQVIAALEQAGSHNVATIWFEPVGYRGWLSDETQFYVNQLQVGDSLLLSYGEHVRRVQANNALAPWLVAFFGLSGGYWLVQAWQRYRQRRQRFDHLFP